MNESASDEIRFAIKLARIDELTKLREILSKLDKEWEKDSPQLGAAQTIGRREAGAVIRGIIRRRIEEIES